MSFDGLTVMAFDQASVSGRRAYRTAEATPDVQFTEDLSGMTLVPGSINVSPLAFNDGAYNEVGNVVTAIAAANGVLANDVEFQGQGISAYPADTHIRTTGAIATAQGGSVTLNANGGFSYLSAPGFTITKLSPTRWSTRAA